MNNKKILVVGGAGYIGSHMVRVLAENQYQPVVFDNLSTGHARFIPKSVPFVKGDLRRLEEIRTAFRKHKIDAVIHFAASIVVPESVANPLKYYENNVCSTVNLLKTMLEFKLEKIIFSSTAAVYGQPKQVPVKENEPTLPANPYGESKLMIEKILRDSSQAYGIRYISLRYFNVAGSHPAGDLGIDYPEVTHLVPSILKMASGERKLFTIFGDDYATSDGTCIRDYIHVMDLCEAHLLALKALEKGLSSEVFNLGNAAGFSVRQVLDVAEKVTGKAIKVKVGPRRPGDPAKIVASSQKAQKLLGWKPRRNLEEIVRSAWVWELNRNRQTL